MNIISVLKLFNDIEQQLDTIDILINNAGIRRDAVLAMMQSDDWHRVIDIGASPKRGRIWFLLMLAIWAQKWLN